MLSKEQKKRLKKILWYSLLVIAAGTFYVWLIILGIIKIPCIVKHVTNLDCPACGGTRMFMAITRLDLYQAFRYNPYIFVTLPYVGHTYYKFVQQYTLNGIVEDKYQDRVLYYAIGLIAFGIIRNIPLFSFLAPTAV